jgi:hypothetical protein
MAASAKSGLLFTEKSDRFRPAPPIKIFFPTRKSGVENLLIASALSMS